MTNDWTVEIKRTPKHWSQQGWVATATQPIKGGAIILDYVVEDKKAKARKSIEKKIEEYEKDLTK